jgi:small subunit ribosomal protein S16
MLKIRFSRIGKKKQPYYRLTIAENSRDPFGKSLEILGSYNPRSKELQSNNERIKYWLKNGAQMTPTINNLLVEKGIIEGKKVVASKAIKKEKKK